MKRINTLLTSAMAAMLGLGLMGTGQTAHAEHVTPPPVPANIQVPAGNVAFLVGHATGTQNYVCLPSGAGVAFTLFTPQATLFDDNGKQIITHFFSPNLNPDPGEKWHDSRHVAGLPGHEHRLGPGERQATPPPTPTSSRRVPSPGSGLRGWSPRRTHRRRHADGHHLHPAAEHLRRARAVDGLYLVNRRRQ